MKRTFLAILILAGIILVTPWEATPMGLQPALAAGGDEEEAVPTISEEEIGAAADDDSFSMMIASDSQFYWFRGGLHPNHMGEVKVSEKGIETNKNMVEAMNAIMDLDNWPAADKFTSATSNGAGADITRPEGVIINGDLTDFGRADQFNRFTAIYSRPPFPSTEGLDYFTYPGLGNHDYANNVDNCRGLDDDDFNLCAKQAVWWMAHNIEDMEANDLGLDIVSKDISGYVTVTNILALFDTRFRVTYNIGNDVVSKTSVRIIPVITGPKTIIIPSDATDIKVRLQVWRFDEDEGEDTWQTFQTFNFSKPTIRCYGVEGVSFAPLYTEAPCTEQIFDAPLPSGNHGSLSYAYNVENYHFVQLHNYPGYEVFLPTKAGDAPSFDVTPSYDWLKKDLQAATDAGKYIVINMHDATDNGDLDSDTRFLDAIANTNVVAIFAGHIHENFGEVTTLTNGNTEIPVILSGSAECERFLLVEFYPRYFDVGVVDASGGTPSFVRDEDNTCDPDWDFNWNFTTDAKAEDKDYDKILDDDEIDEDTTWDEVYREVGEGEGDYKKSGPFYHENDGNPAPKEYIVNFPPTVTASPPSGGTIEGFELTFEAQGSDSDGDTLTYTWDFGNGETATGREVKYTYPDNNKDSQGNVIPYLVTVTANDGFGGEGSASFELTIRNASPLVRGSREPLGTIFEGDLVTHQGTFTDRGSADSFTYEWKLVKSLPGQNTEPLSGFLPSGSTTVPSFQFRPIDNGHSLHDEHYEVELRVIDDDGGVGSILSFYDVFNRDPIVDAGEDLTVFSDELITLNGTFTDPGINDTHTFQWSYAAIPGPGPGLSIINSTTTNPSFRPIDNGVYTLRFEVTDDDGGVGTDTVNINAVLGCDPIPVAWDEFSLDRAIRCANEAGPGLHTITLVEDILLTNLTTPLDNPDATEIIVDGQGHTVDGNGFGPVFEIKANSTVSMNDITIEGGINSTPIGEQSFQGGAVHNRGTFALTHGTVRDNETSGSGGGLFNDTTGVMTLTDSTITGNSSRFGGGIYNKGELTVSNSTINDNTADTLGGGIYNFSGVLALTDSTVNGNTANDNGGGIFNNEKLTVINSTINDNEANDGGGILNSDRLELSDSTVSGNTANDSGGGLYNSGNMTVTNSPIHDNTANDNGGGLYNGGSMTVTQSTVSGNTANDDGGGLYNSGSFAETTVTNSTIHNNMASDEGGGLFNAKNMTVINSTVSGNTANNNGGGFYNNENLELINSTVTNNTANSLGGGIYNFGFFGETTLVNSIVADQNSGVDCFGPTSADGRNLDSDNSCASAFTTSNPLLGPVQDNGGPTWTHALLPGSPAIDTGDNAVCLSAPVNDVDQRGLTRSLQGSTCDMGAFERSAVDLRVSKSAQPNSVPAGDPLTYLIIVSNVGQAPATGVTLVDILPDEVILNNVSHFPADLGLALQMHLDQTEAFDDAVITDSSGQGNHGTLKTGDDSDKATTGQFEQALQFDGDASDYVIINDFNNFPNDQISASFWMKAPAEPRQGRTPISYNVSGNDNMFLVFDYADFQIGIAGQLSPTSGVSANDDQWHHIVVTWRSSDGQLKIYKDGIEAHASIWQQGASFTDGGVFVLGQDQDSPGGGFSDGQAFEGLMDDVALYRRVLSPNEVEALFQGSCGSGNRLACPLGTVVPAQPIAIRIQVTPTTPGQIGNTAWVNRDHSFGPTSDTATVEVTPPHTDLALTKTVTPLAAAPGQDVTYTLTFANDGPWTATDVTITDLIPSGLTNLSVSNTGAAITPSGSQDFVWQVADLEPGVGGIITISGQIDPALNGEGSIINTATIDSPTIVDTNNSNNSSSAELTVCSTAITVTSNADSGPGSLRQALSQVCPGGVIDFNLPTPVIITLTSGPLSIDKALTINGPGAEALAISGNNSSQVFNINGPGVFLNNITITEGRANDGGGIFNLGQLTLNHVTVENNLASSGGGILNGFGGSLIVNRSTIKNNQAFFGGGILNFGGTQWLTNSTLSGNRANGDGGGVVELLTFTTHLLNVTLSANVADADGNGSGDGGGLFSTGTVHMQNTIMAGNMDNSPSGSAIRPDCFAQGDFAEFPTKSHNLIGDNTGCEAIFVDGVDGNQVGSGGSPLDPLLGPLQLNGPGQTETQAVLSGSPAIDGGDNAVCPAADQRGITRSLQGSACDIGAFELVVSETDLVISKDNGQTEATPGESTTYTIVVENHGPSNVSGATVIDTFPADLLDVDWICTPSLSAVCTASGSGDINDIVDIPAGGSVVYTASGDILSTASDTLDNTATVIASSDFIDPNPDNNSTTDSDSLTPVPPSDPPTTMVQAHLLTSDNSSITFVFDLINETAGLNVSAQDSAAPTFECQLDGGGFSPCTSPKTYTNLTPGPHLFEVRSIDGAGNVNPTPASFDWIVDTSLPETCKMYAVHDASTSNSQLFTIEFRTLEETLLSFGPEHPGVDIEGLGLEPGTGILYAVSGLGNQSGSLLYLTDIAGDLIAIRAIRDENGNGFREVSSLAFRQDGTLWGFARQGNENRRGLIKIEPATGIAELVKQSNLDVEGLAWDPTGTTLWLAQQKKLYTYTPEGAIELAYTLSDLPGQIEGLEFRPDGLLMAGIHHGGTINIYTFDISQGNIVTTDSLTTNQFDDVESLVWPGDCPATILKTNTANSNEDSILTYTDVQGNRLEITVPSGALTEQTTFAYTELNTTGIGTATDSFANLAFRLNAYRHGNRLENIDFQPSVVITIEYTEANIAGLDENALGLQYWDRNQKQWQDAACGDYIRHPHENRLVVPICHLTEFGLFGKLSLHPQTTEIYLPVILRQE